MTGRVQTLGYVKGKSVGPVVFGVGTPVSGHGFHYSKLEYDPDANFLLKLSRGKGIVDGRDGLCENQAIGAYTHSYFSARFVESFVTAAKAYKKK